MTIKLLVLSTAKNTNRCVDVMKLQAREELEVVLHLGDKTAHYKASSLSRMKASIGTRGHIMANRRFSGSAFDIFETDTTNASRDLFLDHLGRTSAQFRYKSHPLRTPQGLTQYYDIVADALAGEIRASGATH